MTDRSLSISGVLPVFQTPYFGDGSEAIQFQTLRKELDWLFECGADGVVMAMVSEVLRLSSEERETLAVAACTAARDHNGACVISVGAESSVLAERYACHAERAGATAVMAIPPVSVAVDEAELDAYFRRILDAIGLPVIVQDASNYVGEPMTIEFQAGLMNEFGAERVMFKPEASPFGPRLSALHEATDGKAKIFEGSGGIALIDSHARGITGTMPGADLIRALVPLWQALEAGESEIAGKIHSDLEPLLSLQNTLDSYLAVEKHLLKRQGIFENELVRGPVGFRLDDETRAEIDRLFDALLETISENSA
ncbi:MAG: dihydrodipicolinate synthase family protein [Verrucomicrobiales bacterium]|nr:dihydrodipicolinate synthase family protein [Verrucomicrobiales bacterium]